MNKLQALKCIEITSQRQADNGTICYYDPITGASYTLYESGYVRRKPKTGFGIYQLNQTRIVVQKNNWEKTERVLLNSHVERMECAAKAVVNYRNTLAFKKQPRLHDKKRIALIAIEDEIRQYYQGNLTIEGALEGIKYVVNKYLVNA